GGEAGDRRALGRRPARLAARAPAPARREPARAREGDGRARRGEDRRALGRRDRRRLGRDRRGGARPRAEGPRRDDRERLRLRRLRRARVPAGRALPDHAHGELLRQAQPAAVPRGARRDRPRGRRAARRRRGDPRRPRRARRPLARRPPERDAAPRGAAGAALPRGPLRGARRPAAEPRVSRVGARRTEILFLACAFSITWEKIHWSFGGNIALEDILAGLFVLSFALDRLAAGDRRVQRTAAIVLLFFAAFLLVYLVGFFNLDTKQSLDQFVK